MALIGQLKQRYPVDPDRIYASGFSMGGCKSWDLYQEYPELFAGLAPMSATFEVGLNLYGQPAAKPINRDVPVPLYYAAGEQTPLPELPCQAEKCLGRVQYVFEVNRVAKANACRFEDRTQWEDPLWGVSGDETRRIPDPSRGAVLTEQRFLSRDGVCRTVLASIDNQGHECREHTCEQAWQFLRAFRRD
jgi:poly(3-hydroxybutyrate) depolymerase